MSDSVVDTVLSELNSPVEEPAPEEPAVEEPVEEPAPEEPAPEEPVEEPVEEPAVAEPVTTQEVVQNVQEMLSSTDTSGSVNELENRVKVLEERLESVIGVLITHKFTPIHKQICELLKEV